MTREAVLSLQDVSKRYGTVQALDSVSFHLDARESVGYLGPNGAGKTTTLKLLAGVTRPDSGTIRLGGFDPVRQRQPALSRTGFLIEMPGTLPYLTGEDLLRYVAELKGIPRPEWSAAGRKAADAAGATENLSRRLGTLSTGQLRRVLISSALVGDPEVLVLDEPTLGLDPAARRDIRALLRALRKEGRTLLLSTHLLEDAEAVCDRVIFLRDGKILGDEPISGARGENGALTAIRVRTLDPSTPEALQKLLPDSVRVHVEGDRQFSLSFSGDEAFQSELIGRLVHGGIRLSSVTESRSSLEDRYLRLVGREDRT